MSVLPAPPPLAEVAVPDARGFAEIRAAGQPVVIRGLVADWPVVTAARRGDAALVEYLGACGTSRPVKGIIGEDAANRRFFYNAALTDFNFRPVEGLLDAFLANLLATAEDPQVPPMAVQSELIPELSPRLAAENRLALLPEVPPRIWIGNRIRVAPHYDMKENVACCVAGRRTFTLMPPEQLANLYPGPFERTPAGTPVSMVDPRDPDLARFPRFAEAWASATQATLEPGDAIYVPFGWWHGVESLDPLNILINYWWTQPREGLAGPYDALLHAMLAWRHLPPAERAVWQRMVNHYVFEANGDPAAHLPPPARGILGEPSPQLLAQMHAMLRQTLG